MADDKKPGEEGKLSDDPIIKAIQESQKQFGKQLEGMLSVVQQTTTQNKALAASVESLTKALEGRETPKDDDKGPDDETLNGMTQSELVSHMMGGFTKLLDTKMKGYDGKLESFAKDVNEGRAEEQLEKFAKDHKDLVDWAPEIKARLAKNPSLTLPDAYTLVRTANPEKTKELDTKYQEVKPEDDKGTKPKFGGLTPTSTITGTGDEAPEKLSPKEAGEKAWEDTLKEYPILATATGADT